MTVLALWLALIVVDADKISVHQGNSSTTPIVQTLPRNQPVVVTLRVTQGDDEWCQIQLPGAAAPLGYVLCRHLRSTSPPSKPRHYQAVTEAPAPSPAGTPQHQPPAHSLSPESWMDALNLNSSQRAQTATLMRTSGLTACRQTLAAQFLKLGITDITSYMDWLSGTREPQRTIQAAQLGAIFEPCMQKYLDFWRQFERLLTPQQITRAGNEFLFLRYTLQSAPEMLVFGDVTRHIRRPH